MPKRTLFKFYKGKQEEKKIKKLSPTYPTLFFVLHYHRWRLFCFSLLLMGVASQSQFTAHLLLQGLTSIRQNLTLTGKPCYP